MKDKKKGKLKWVIIAIIAIAMIGIAVGGGNDSDKASDKNPKKVNSSSSSENNKDKQEVKEEKKENKNEQQGEDEKIFAPGDVVEASDLQISFVSAKKYKSDNEFLQPKKGNIFYKMEFEFENISDSDKTLSTVMDWTCYADSYKVDQNHLEDDNGLDATLSPGKKAKGSVYFEIPKDSKEITLEYSPSFWSDNKIVFKAK